jgi:hypothetical protein
MIFSEPFSKCLWLFCWSPHKYSYTLSPQGSQLFWMAQILHIKVSKFLGFFYFISYFMHICVRFHFSTGWRTYLPAIEFPLFTFILYWVFFIDRVMVIGGTCLTPFQQYFSYRYVIEVSFIGGGNRRKQPTCQKSLKNFIT